MHKEEQCICHVTPMIQVKMNNRGIMHFSVCAVVARRTFISFSLCSHLPQNVNDPDSAGSFSPQSPNQQVGRKRERCCTCLYVCVLSEPVGLSLFASSRAAVFIADSLASTESPALTRVPVAVAPEASREKLQGPYRGLDCFQQHTFIREPKALSKLIVRELTASLQKGLNACSLIIWILVNWINC